MRRQFERPYLALLTAAALWAAFNCVYVYFVAGEGQSYRIESAVLVLAGLAIPLCVSRGWTPEAAGETLLSDRLGFSALALLWLTILGPLLSFPFLSDDYGFLTAYRGVSDAVRPFAFYRPVFGVAFLVLSRVGGGSPAAFHAAAFALHLASGWLVYRLARRLSGGPAIAAAAVFLLNPVQLEAVLWASGLQELLWTFFLLAAFVLWTTEERVSAGRCAAVTALIALALWSKETAICVVLLLPIVEFAAFGVRRIRQASAMLAIAATECVVYLALRARAVTIEGGFFVTPSHYFVKQMLVIPYEVFVHPWNRSAIEVPMAALCLAALAAIGLVLTALWRGPSLSTLAGPAVIVATVLPVYSLFYVAPDLAGSRYLYFGSAGFGILVAELLGRTPPVVRAAAVSALAVVFGWSLALNLRPWRAAADLVEAVREAVVADESPAPSIATWQATHPPGLVLKDGIPDSYQGVWVFRNGYEAFVAHARR